MKEIKGAINLTSKDTVDGIKDDQFFYIQDDDYYELLKRFPPSDKFNTMIQQRNENILNNVIVTTEYPSRPDFDDISGNRYHHLTCIKYIGKDKGNRKYFLFKCDCGNEIIIYGNRVTSGLTWSCGCYRMARKGAALYKYGIKNNRLYRIWLGMRRRCYDKNYEPSYKNYGGRGIIVCDSWRYDFKEFRDWALANGYDDSLSIDRIDNDGNYEPDNCRWVSMKDQANNRSTNLYITINGYKYSLSEWSDITGIPRGVIRNRLRRGWDDYSALSTPYIPFNYKKDTAIHILTIPEKYIDNNHYNNKEGSII